MHLLAIIKGRKDQGTNQISNNDFSHIVGKPAKKTTLYPIKNSGLTIQVSAVVHKNY